jgi:predicted dehydrogenase/threonine dehydrogenase-like Zn-dependent dehydrogenase
MLVEFGKAGWIEKARQQPDKVRMLLDKVKADGLFPTLHAVRNKLDQPVALGYCNVGIVMQVGVTGDGATSNCQWTVGDRVASNGKHAEVVNVPMNLCAKVPPEVSDEEAAFTAVSAIALQGIRLVQPSLGECVVVTGLGLIGLLTVQLLRAHGCRVLGVDFDSDKLMLAKRFGAEVVNLSSGEDPIAAAQRFSRGRGIDAVLITASTTSNEPVHQAALMCRKRGRIVLVGVTGLELSRADFYEKELSFQVSCSYGPGRYDSHYEERGFDYPIGFVRWTEQRNFEAVLDMMADGRLDVKPLISHRFRIEEAALAYQLLGSSEPSLGIVLQYPDRSHKSDEELRVRTVCTVSTRSAPLTGQATLSIIGAGNYATAVLIPAFKKTGVRLKTIGSSGGVTSVHAGGKYGFEEMTTDIDKIIADSENTALVIATRHNSHAEIVCRALNAGKHVFVEKPLALTLEEVEQIQTAHERASRASSNSTPRQQPLLMVGFNRRFSPQVDKMKSLLATVQEPKAFIMTVNAGVIPGDHWTHDRVVGGGRIIGEACHFVDLLRYLAGSPITSFEAVSIGKVPGIAIAEDKASIILRFDDGSMASIHYLANGHKSFPKERLEVFAGGRILQLNNYRKLKGFGWPKFTKMNLWRQNKGQNACVEAFVQAVITQGPAPIPFDELMEVSRISIQIAEALH